MSEFQTRGDPEVTINPESDEGVIAYFNPVDENPENDTAFFRNIACLEAPPQETQLFPRIES